MTVHFINLICKIEELQDYLGSRNSSARYRNKTAPSQNWCFGLDVYNNILLHLERVHETDAVIDIRPYHLFYERSGLLTQN
ncbi:hypothetical protein [Paenibacillus nasutitermitis]|uniref:Uncharacterized protein n=1 Tax=Paenibacillus nasutitermitis TaxID=1652958 RepID=A0A916YNE6_9BACL|nr:hypothetical protein [Paenibacillus nasutitermitis]GGD52323.1 hypothetical protein GCM10010911_07290 [Paenibacillus nasutitermitis]